MFVKLRAVRKNANITAEMMASLLGLETKAAYYKKEKGVTKFTLAEAKAVSDYLNVPITELFFAHEVSKMETK